MDWARRFVSNAAVSIAVVALCGCGPRHTSVGDGGSSNVVDPVCGALVAPGETQHSGGFCAADLCPSAGDLAPCGREAGPSVGLRISPEYPSIVTVTGFVRASGEVLDSSYVALRRDCSTPLEPCAFGPNGAGVSASVGPGETVVAQGGVVGDRSCASTEACLAVWILECGTQVLRPTRDGALLSPATTWDDASSTLFMGLQDALGWYDLSSLDDPRQSEWISNRWHAQDTGDVISVTSRGDVLYLLSSVCSEREFETDFCIETTNVLEVYRRSSGEFLFEEDLGVYVYEIATLGDRLLLFADDVAVYGLEAPAAPRLDERLSPAVGPVRRAFPIDDVALLLVTEHDVFVLYREGDAVVAQALTNFAEDMVAVDYTKLDADGGLLVVAGYGGDLRLVRVQRLPVAPYVALELASELWLDVRSSRSVTVVGPHYLVAHHRTPVGEDFETRATVYDVSDPSMPERIAVFDAESMADLADIPSRPGMMLIDERRGIGVVDLLSCLEGGGG